MKPTVEQILKEHHLSVTDGRRIILDLFMHADQALANAEIEKKCKGIFDRMSIYRTLQSFVKKNIIHIIPTSDDTIKYALSKVNPEKKERLFSHVHFVCSNCKKTICLNMINIPEIILPDGFKIRNCEVLIKGVCADCK